MKLLNAREELLATLTHVRAASNWGWFQMGVAGGGGGASAWLMRLYILGAVALLEYERRQKKISAVAEVVGGVGGGTGQALA